MAVLQKILELLIPLQPEQEIIVSPAPATTYEIRPLTSKYIKELLHINQRCFRKGETYTKYTFSFLLSEPNTLSYRIETPTEEIVAFIFVTVSEDGVGHITTIGVAPEHRRRGLAQKLLLHVEEALRERGINTIVLEVRVDNKAAQNLYRQMDYAVVQRLLKYYTNGEDGFLLVKFLLK